jgi:hypothetical protein
MEKHQRQECVALAPFRAPGTQFHQQAPEAHSLQTQLLPHKGVPRRRGIPLVKDEIHDGEHRLQPRVEDLRRRDGIGDLCIADLALSPYEPLRHRGERDEERPGDLLGREPTDRSQCESDLGLSGQRRMAAGEHQPQLVVLDLIRFAGFIGGDAL